MLLTCQDKKIAEHFARRDGKRFGMLPTDGYWYVGTAEHLKTVGITPITPDPQE